MKSTSKAKILVTNTSWVYVNKIIVGAFGLLVTVLVLRKLTVGDYGLYNFLLTTFVVFEIFTVYPINSVFNRYIPEYVANNNSIAVRKLMLLGGGIALIVIVLFLGVFLTFQPLFATIFKIDNFQLYRTAFLLYTSVALLKAFLLSLAAAFLLHRSLSIVNMMVSFISPIVYLSLINYLTVNVMLYIETGLAFLAAGMCLFVLVHHLRTVHPVGEQENYSLPGKRMLRFGIFSAFNEIGSGIVGNTSDYLIVSALSNQYSVGLYSFANRLNSLVFKVLPMQDFLSVVRPLFIGKFSQQYERSEFVNMFNFIVKVMLPVCLLPALFFIAFGHEIIEYVFDPKYASAYWVTSIVLLTNIWIAIFYPQGLTIILKEKMEVALYGKSVVVLSIFGGVILMKMFGIIGVACATFVGTFLNNLIMQWLIRKEIGPVYRFKEYLRFIPGTLLILGAGFLLRLFVINLVTLVIASASFVLVAFFIFIFLHPYNDADLALFEKVANTSRMLRKVASIIGAVHRYGMHRWNTVKSK